MIVNTIHPNRLRLGTVRDSATQVTGNNVDQTVMTYTVPGRSLRVGDVFEVRASGTIVSAGVASVVFTVRYATTTIYSITADFPVATQHFDMQIYLRVQSFASLIGTIFPTFRGFGKIFSSTITGANPFPIAADFAAIAAGDGLIVPRTLTLSVRITAGAGAETLNLHNGYIRKVGFSPAVVVTTP